MSIEEKLQALYEIREKLWVLSEIVIATIVEGQKGLMTAADMELVEDLYKVYFEEKADEVRK